jgi:tight adherence protein C
MNLLAEIFTEQAGIIVIVFLAVFIFIYAFVQLLDDYYDPVRSRYKGDKLSQSYLSLTVDELSERLRKHNSVFVPKGQQLIKRTILRLNYAGFHNRNSFVFYFALRTILMISLPLLASFSSILIHSIKGELAFYLIMGMLVIGYIGPSFTLDKLIAKRQKKIRRAFPDALDLLVVCSEAGLSLDAALQRVTSEISMSQPVLAEELEIVISETRAGIERHTALQRLVERTGVEDIKGLVAALSQSMRFGTSIVETLKDFSDDLRDKRTQAAEEVAAKIGVKLIFPLVLCLMPAFLLVTMAPAVLAFKSI